MVDLEYNDKVQNIIDGIETHEVNAAVKYLIKNGYNNKAIFDAAFEFHSLQKVGHLSDKVYELFSELSHCSSINLPKNKTITVYRGCGCESYVLNGVSWTLDKNIADWFAQRFSRGSPVVASLEISTSGCIGSVPNHLLEFDVEKEVIIHPELINEDDITIEPMTKKIKVDMETYLTSCDGILLP